VWCIVYGRLVSLTPHTNRLIALGLFDFLTMNWSFDLVDYDMAGGPY
jgi:hypothetical protein